MKARKLRELLNNTGYNVHHNKEYVCIGSPMCSDLINVNKETLKVRFALDTFNEGRNCLTRKDSTELLFIWDKLHELIESGEIKDIIEGNDEIENKLPVFTYDDDFKIIESYTDKYGYPNTTFDGYLMYENSHFKTKKEAIDKAISECGYYIKHLTEMIEEKSNELVKKHEELRKQNNNMLNLKSLK